MKNFKNALMMSTVLILVGCNQQPVSRFYLQDTQPQIYGGKAVGGSEDIAKVTVGLYTNYRGQTAGSVCTGTLIASDLVLTAAHCVEGAVERIRIFFETEMAEDSLFRSAKAFAGYEKYDGRNINVKNLGDLALIHFDGGLPAGYTTAKVLTDFSQIKNGTVVTAAGYGVNWVFLKPSGSGKLRKLDIRVQDVNYSNTEIKLDNKINKGICSGDSGGPSFVKKDNQLYILGVTSRGSGLPVVNPCADSAIVTKPGAYAEWLVKTAARLRNR